MGLIDYQRDGEAVFAVQHVSEDFALTLRAENVYREPRNGHLKTKLYIIGNDRTLYWGSLDADTDEDRVRAKNSAMRHLANGDKNSPPLIPETHLKYLLDAFCDGLWPQVMEDTAPKFLEGDTDLSLPDFVLEPFMVEGAGTIMFGPPGHGKSWMLMLQAVSIDAGSNALWTVKQGRTLFINLERSESSFKRRLGVVNRVLGLPPNRPLLTQQARGKSLSDVLDSARDAIKRHGVTRVVLDSISRSGFGDLNENRPGNAVIDGLNSLGVSWMALAHSPRGDDSHIYGSVMFEAGADIMVQLSSQQKDKTLGIGLAITKENDLGPQPSARRILRLEFNEFGLCDVQPARKGEFPDVENGRKLSAKERLDQYLADVNKASATMVAKTLGGDRTNWSRMLANDNDFVLVPGAGKEKFYGRKTDWNS